MARYSSEGLKKIRQVNEGRFLRDAHAKFGNKFDYSLMVYQRQKEPIIIICPDHGKFQQTPDKHLQSANGCPKCGIDVRSTSRTNAGRQEFAKEFKSRFGDRLELISHYISSRSPIQVRCKTHGIEFNATPDSLRASPHGCPKCVSQGASLNRLMSEKEIRRRIFAKFGDQFDLSKAKFKGLGKTTTIICSIHSEFQMTPGDFLQTRHGCPKCGRLHTGYAETRIQRLEQGVVRSRPTTLALLKVEIFGISGYKLGTTNRTVMSRYREALREIIFETTLDELDALKLERRLHGKYFRWRDTRVFLAGLRSGQRWSGDSEIYQEQCVPHLLADLREAVAALQEGDSGYWERSPKLVPPILKIRPMRKERGVFNQSKAVIRLDSKEVFASATAAAKAIGSTQGLVSLVCSGKRGHTKGIRFAYLTEYKAGKHAEHTSRTGENHPRARAVRCIDTNAVYSTVSAAARDTGVHSGKIVAVCKGSRRTAGGLRWAYSD
jgi:Protein of unknown function (DUF723)